MSGVKIIKETDKNNSFANLLIDCPPGTACTTVSCGGIDFAVIVQSRLLLD